MADHGADTDEATALVRWLLESGVRGLGLTKTHALQRATVREAAAIQQAFGWWDDHLYSFWLDGSFFGGHEVELTTPEMPDAGVATADVPIAELGLGIGQRIGYVFDFGDDWRVRLTVRERIAAEAGDHPRVLELRGAPPPQYAAIED